MNFSSITQHIVSTLCDLIKLARKERGMPQKDLAERMGVDVKYIQHLENGDMTIPIGDVIECAIIVGVPLFGGDKEQIHNLSTMLTYMHKLIPERIVKDKVVKDDF